MRSRLIVLLFLTATPAWAQQLEVTPLIGYTTSGDIDQTTTGVSDLTIDGAMTWGAQGTWFVTDRVGLEGVWTYRSTDVSMASGSGRVELFEMTANVFQGSLVYRFGPDQSALRPFVFGGAGATLLDAPDYRRETKASWAVGGGLTWYAQRHVGVKAVGRYAPTVLGGSESDICTPFGFCQRLLNTFDIFAGAAFRF